MPVVKTLRLGGLDDWAPGWVRKVWEPMPDLLQSDGTMFGGYLAALADQTLAFATMSVLADDLMIAIIRSNHAFMRILEAVRDCDPPDRLVGAGVLRNLVWDHLHGYRVPTPHRDVDVAFFDPADLSSDHDRQVETRLAGGCPAYRGKHATRRLHGARTITDPNGRVTITVGAADALIRYRFGLKTADYLVCGRCGVYVAAVLAEEGSSYATVNLNTFESSERFTQPPMPVSYDGETETERRARRREKWTPAVPVIEGGVRPA